MPTKLIFNTLGTLLLASTAAGLEPLVINEIHFRPTGRPENRQAEFVEIYNPGTAAVGMEGMKIGKGVDFSFSQTTQIPGGGYLVVAADPAYLLAQNPGLDPATVLGPWSGGLSNSGETVRLEAADGTALSSVKYATEGDWGNRIRVVSSGTPGWGWEAWADGNGYTLERRVASLPANNGQNWGRSSNLGGTPGKVNSLNAATIAPLIDKVKHAPTVPAPSQAVTISAEIIGSSTATVQANVHWRVSTASPGAFNVTPMSRVGLTDVFTAVLPAQQTLTVVEFYVSAAGDALTRTWPAPNNLGQTTNCLYQVEAASFIPDVPTYRQILAVPEQNLFSSMSTHSDAEMNCTFIADDGTTPVIRYNAGVRYRGASSRDRLPTPNRLNLPDDRSWNGTTKINLNTQYTWLQFLGMKLMATSGLRAPNTRKMIVKRNGVTLMTDTTAEASYGLWAHLEPLGSEFVTAHFPGDDSGDLYKKVRPDNNWAYRSGNANTYVSDGWVKSTNSSDNDWSRLDNFLRVMNQAQGSPTYLDQVQAVADLDEWAKWFAVETLLTNGETNASNGVDDDYSLYFRASDGKAVFVPHDFDTILGQGDSSRITNTSHTLFDMTENVDDLGPLVALFGTTAGGGNATFRAKYFENLRQLCLTSFSAARFDALLDSQLSGWVPAAKSTELKAFMNARRTFVLGQCATALGTPTPAAPVPSASGGILAPAKALQINELLLHNVTAFTSPDGPPSYLELKNTTADPLNLTGKRIGRTEDDTEAFVFPEGATLAAGEYVLVLLNSHPGQYSTLFSLNRMGGSLGLWDSVEAGGALLDSIVWGPQVADRSIGRVQNGSYWTLMMPTPAASNGANLTLGSLSGIRINEWLAVAQNRLRDEFVEITNPTSAIVNLGGARITDDAINGQTHRFADLSFLAPNSQLALQCRGNTADPSVSTELPFQLSGDHDWISILGTNGVVVDEAHSLSMKPDISRGKQTDLSALMTNFTLPTPGMPNATSSKLSQDPAYTLAAKLMQSIRITEVMYRPGMAEADEELEYIEIKNIGAEALNLQGLRFSSGIQFTFPSYTLAPGAFGLVVANSTAFTAKYGPGKPIIGQTVSRLSNNGELIELQLPAPFTASVQIFSYNDKWHPSTNGGGYSLVVTDPRNTLPLWDEASGWVPSDALGGNPGTQGLPRITSVLHTQTTLGLFFNYQVVATNVPTSYSAIDLPPGVSLNATTGLIFGLPTQAGNYAPTITVSNAEGNTSAELVIDVNLPPPPVISSPLTASAYSTAPFSYTIAATNNATVYSVGPLPAWLSFSSSSHALTGTPTAGGTVTVEISVSNAGGTTTANLVISIADNPFIGALEGAGLSYTTGGAANWFVQSTTTHDGVDAVESGNIDNSEECWLQTQVTGPDQISFWWSSDSESGWDFLNFNVDGVTIQSISGVTPWQRISYVLPAGAHTIRWLYRKDSSASTVKDAVWLDEVRLASQSPEPTIISDLTASVYQDTDFSYQIVATNNPTTYTATNLPVGLGINPTTGLITGRTSANAGVVSVTVGVSGPTGSSTGVLLITITSSPENFAAAIEQPLSTFTRTTTGQDLWFAQTTTSRDGDAAQAGPMLVNNTTTRFETTVQGPDRVSFWWKCSTYQYGGYFYFYLDGRSVRSISGEQDWREFVVDLDDGPHTLRWELRRGSSSGGTNSAWVDNLVIGQLSPTPVILSPLYTYGYTGEDFLYQILSTGSPTSYAAQNLPVGLTLDPTTGAITGSPTTTGVVPVTVQATGATGTGSHVVQFDLAANESAMYAALDQPENAPLFLERSGPSFTTTTSPTLRGGTSIATPKLTTTDANSQLSITFATTEMDRISFWWKGGFGSGSFYMYSYLDGNYIGSISGDTAWQQVVRDLQPGPHNLAFYAYRYDLTISGQNTGWIDDLRIASLQPLITSPLSYKTLLGSAVSYQSTVSKFTNPVWSATGLPAGLTLAPTTGTISGIIASPGRFAVTLKATQGTEFVTVIVNIDIVPNPGALVVGGDGAGLSWAHVLPSNAYWYSQSTVTHDGVDALQSGNVGHNQRSQFSVTTKGRGQLRLWWRASSEQYSDELVVYRDGSWWDSISGSTAWTSYSLSTSNEGETVYTFSFQRDSATSFGSNAVWVDEIQFVPEDLDTDGLSDSWERLYFGSTSSSAALNADTDGDGMTDGAEQRAGTSPVDGLSHLLVSESHALPDGSVQLNWNSIPGRTYTLQSSSNLKTWTNYPARIWASGTTASATVAPLSTTTSNLTLVSSTAPARALVPVSTTSQYWNGIDETAFAAAGGETNWYGPLPQGVGYERDNVATASNVPYTSYIGLNVGTTLYSINTSVYIRIPFNVTNPDLLRSLTLQMRYDDGYAAYINGVPVASDRAPATLPYNAEATSSRNDPDAVNYSSSVLDAFLGQLKPGRNILAIHGLNRGITSSDFLIQSQLLATQSTVLPKQPKIYWRVVAE